MVRPTRSGYVRWMATDAQRGTDKLVNELTLPDGTVLTDQVAADAGQRIVDAAIAQLKDSAA